MEEPVLVCSWCGKVHKDECDIMKKAYKKTQRLYFEGNGNGAYSYEVDEDFKAIEGTTRKEKGAKNGNNN